MLFAVGETAIMAIEAWRGVPSHYNFSTPFDAALMRGGAAGTAGVFLVGARTDGQGVSDDEIESDVERHPELVEQHHIGRIGDGKTHTVVRAGHRQDAETARSLLREELGELRVESTTSMTT